MIASKGPQGSQRSLSITECIKSRFRVALSVSGELMSVYLITGLFEDEEQEIVERIEIELEPASTPTLERLRVDVANINNDLTTRARFVGELLLKCGGRVTPDQIRENYIDTSKAVDELRSLGGYDIPFERGVYILNENEADPNVKGRRRAAPNSVRKLLIQKCQGCGDTHKLTADHKVPYLVNTNQDHTDPATWAMLCVPCQNKKRRECSECEVQLSTKDESSCKTCYYSFSPDYIHIALRPRTENNDSTRTSIE